jgi:hypothetical protein
MRLKGRSQRYLAVLSACCVVYFWGTWKLHSHLDDVSAGEVKDGKPKLPSKLLAPNEPAQVERPPPPPAEGKLVAPDKPARVVPPPSPPSDGTFSACLLVMDDNHFLIEWLVSSEFCLVCLAASVSCSCSDNLCFGFVVSQHACRSILAFLFFTTLQAYHYHTLPLRHLIVSVDPRSKTSPAPILDRWRKHGMDIVQWKDDDFMPPQNKKAAEDHVRQYFGDISPDLVQHRARQRLFYFRCMERLKDQGRDWTLLVDTDEYIYINYPTVAALNLTAPPINQTGSVMSFLKEELQRPGHNLSTPCVQMPRMRFGTQESEVANIEHHVPVGFNASMFQTLRWRKHASSDNYFANRISKTMIDLSRVAWNDLVPVDSIHMPIRSMCGQRRLHIRKEDQVFAINHYLGTWDQYSYRDDSRTGKERSRKVRWLECLGEVW